MIFFIYGEIFYAVSLAATNGQHLNANREVIARLIRDFVSAKYIDVRSAMTAKLAMVQIEVEAEKTI